MTAIHETAYPRIRPNPTSKELLEIYTPDSEEMKFAASQARSSVSRLGFLILLKTFQRLGYFPQLETVSAKIIRHIAEKIGVVKVPNDFKESYNEKSPFRWRHMALIRSYLGITSFSEGGKEVMEQALMQAARTKNILADLINAAIEELVRQNYELPAFSNLRRSAYTARSSINKEFYGYIYVALGEQQKEIITDLLKIPEDSSRSLWYRLKQEPKRATTKNMREFVLHMKWLQSLNVGLPEFRNIPEIKLTHFAEEATSLTLSRLNEVEEEKRFALVTILISKRIAEALDDFCEIFIRQVQSLHNHGRESLRKYRDLHQDQADELIKTLESIATVWKEEDNTKRIDGVNRILGDRAESIIRQCNEHLLYAENNYLPFLSKLYRSQRKNFFNFIEIVRPKSTSADLFVEKTIEFLIQNKHRRAERIAIEKKVEDTEGYCMAFPLADLNWIPDNWWKLVTGKPKRSLPVRTVERKLFEICLFSTIMRELKSGDLFIPGSDEFNDYRKQFCSDAEYEADLDDFCKQMGYFPKTELFIEFLQNWLRQTIKATDQSFLANERVEMRNGEPVIRKSPRKEPAEGLQLIEQLLEERLPQISIIDVLSDTEHWLNWTSHFSPVSGLQGRLKNPQESYIITTFCYGCNLGPKQTARSFDSVDRKQIAYINQRHINQEKIQRAIGDVINAYNRFSIPKIWGVGQRASADGTIWDIYHQNLLSEYHIRYGGYGGIGYYHIADNYIALFSHFIPCSVYEAIYILDGLIRNTSDVQPDTLHADTHGQSEVVFALAYLLGIKLMPRIKNWKDLKFYLPEGDMEIHHIKEIFSDTINWNLIRTHLPDMLKVALSISKGKITSATILRRLGTYSHKNKIYFAFKELGKVIRTIFLLNYLADEELRKTIRAATVVSEEWNDFIQWVAFGEKGVLTENIREEQRKAIKYNHLISNLLIFHNVASMTKILSELKDEGYQITPEIISGLAPYRRMHINRFGKYELRFDQKPEPLKNNEIFVF
jgi:TnpA family transposase